MIDQRVFINWAKEAGFAEAAFCDIEDFRSEAQIVAKQKELHERKQLRFYPKEEYAQAVSLAVLLWTYQPAALHSDAVFIDSYYEASNAAYHAANQLEARLNQSGIFAKANVSYPAKAAAIRAGMGIIGKNSLLITPKYGTRVVIILMATGIPMDSHESSLGQTSCMECKRCISICPVKALDEHGMSHPERCLRNYMLEGNVVPPTIRSKIGMSLLGCDLCQRVCPMQTMTQEKHVGEQFRLDGFVTDNTALFSQSVARLAEVIGRNTARPQRIRAQAAILAGNAKDPRYLPILRRWAQSDFEAVRTHAEWAIQQIEQEEINPVRT